MSCTENEHRCDSDLMYGRPMICECQMNLLRGAREAHASMMIRLNDSLAKLAEAAEARVRAEIQRDEACAIILEIKNAAKPNSLLGREIKEVEHLRDRVFAMTTRADFLYDKLKEAEKKLFEVGAILFELGASLREARAES